MGKGGNAIFAYIVLGLSHCLMDIGMRNKLELLGFCKV